VLKIWPVPSKDGHEGNLIPVGIGFLGIQYTNHGLAWDRLGHGITKVVSEAPAVGCGACRSVDSSAKLNRDETGFVVFDRFTFLDDQR
jgi:hypothetical protein